MKNRDWQKVAVGCDRRDRARGFLPVWLTAARLAALVVGVALGVVAVVLRGRLRRRQLNQPREQPRDWAGANDAAYHRQPDTNPHLVPRPHQRWSGF